MKELKSLKIDFEKGVFEVNGLNLLELEKDQNDLIGQAETVVIQYSFNEIIVEFSGNTYVVGDQRFPQDVTGYIIGYQCSLAGLLKKAGVKVLPRVLQGISQEEKDEFYAD